MSKFIYEFKKQPIFWICTVPFVILFLPLGFLLASFTLFYDLKFGKGWKDFRKDGFYTPLKPGYYVSIFLLSAIPKNKRTIKKEYNQGS
ncbi:hypothetical protein CN918_26740 [Priestia megaterium]|nr:hypothetical protein CN918_26740 [Priestia megaterium]